MIDMNLYKDKKSHVRKSGIENLNSNIFKSIFYFNINEEIQQIGRTSRKMMETIKSEHMIEYRKQILSNILIYINSNWIYAIEQIIQELTNNYLLVEKVERNKVFYNLTTIMIPYLKEFKIVYLKDYNYILEVMSRLSSTLKNKLKVFVKYEDINKIINDKLFFSNLMHIIIRYDNLSYNDLESYPIPLEHIKNIKKLEILNKINFNIFQKHYRILEVK